MSVIQFPARLTAKPCQPREFQSFADLTPSDSDLDARASELMQDALNVVSVFDPDAVAQMLAYAAARLERTGFKMFN